MTLPPWLRRWLRPRRLAMLAVAGALVLGITVWSSVGLVHRLSSGRVYTSAAVPSAPVAIVFGAEVYPNGQPSPYLRARLRLGKRLLAAGKVRAILLTGDHGRWTYDEPDAMRGWLIHHGVPARKLAVDYAGFDTYQSCSRAYRIFGVRKAILVSQDFSIQRSVALCQSVGITAYGVADHSQPRSLTYARGWTRDQLADVKAVYCMAIQPDPKYLGRHETTVDRAVNSE